MGDVRVSDQVAEIAQTAVLRPGDTLIVRVPTGSTHDAVGRALGGLRRNLPDVEVLVVAAEELAIYRPEPEGITVRPDDVVVIGQDDPNPICTHGNNIAVVRPAAGQ